MINDNAMDIDDQGDREERQYAFSSIQKDDILKDRSFNEVSVLGQLWAMLKHEVSEVRLAALKVLMCTSCNFPCIMRIIINCNECSIDSLLLSNVLKLCFPLGDLDMRPSDIPADQRCNISICLSFLQCFLEIRPQTISLLSEPLAFYRNCFRYLCHPDFFLRTFNILKLAFEHLEGSAEVIRVQEAVNDFFSQRTSAFEGAELEQITTISKETANSLKFEHQLSDKLAMSDFWQCGSEDEKNIELPDGIPAIWQVYWSSEESMLEFLVSTLEDPPQDDISYCNIGTHLSNYVQHDWLCSFFQQFLGRRINIHSMISVTNDNFLVFSPDANEEMNEMDIEMNVDAMTEKNIISMISKAGGQPVYDGQVSMNEVEVEVVHPKAMNELEVVHPKASGPSVYDDEKEASKDSHQDIAPPVKRTSSHVSSLISRFEQAAIAPPANVVA